MNALPRIVFHVGGPAFHPVAEQAALIQRWLGDDVVCAVYDGAEAFEHLDQADLLVLMGLHWTGMNADWAGGLTYCPLSQEQRRAFELYVGSGRPLLCHHGVIASYDDWPRFGELLGFTWVWGTTTHSPIGSYVVEVLPTGHPIIAGVEPYHLYDELYYNVRVTPGLQPMVHATTTWDDRPAPMVMSAEGGRIAGSGRTVYLANGHDMRAFESLALKQLWINAVGWLLDGAAHKGAG